MATTEFDIHQYQWQFVEPPPEDCFCTQCKRILKEPMLTECCGTHICKECAEPNIVLRKLIKCPSCKQASVSCFLDKMTWRGILKLEVYCSLKIHGCMWTGCITVQHTHLVHECQYRSIECRRCKKEVRYHMMQEHLDKVCSDHQSTPKTTVKPVQYEVLAEELAQRKTAAENMTLCPQCKAHFLKRCNYDQEEHMKQCPEQIVPCNFQFTGCDVYLERKHMTQHMEDNIQGHSCFQSKLVCSKVCSVDIEHEHMIKESDAKFKQLTRLAAGHSTIIEEQIQAMEDHVLAVIEEITDIHEHLEHAAKVVICSHDSMLWELGGQQLELETRLAAGQFSEVWKGLQHGEQQVAIKTLKSGSLTSSTFLQEAQILKQLKHENVIQLIGVCTSEEPFLIVTEFMALGNLTKFLRNDGRTILLPQQVDIIKQVASGMVYLESLNCIHRSLTTRSILVHDNLLCKIASFTLARILDKDQREYTIPQGERVPIKWSAPEVLEHSKCSTKSDVWSFGMLQYEVVTKGGFKMPKAKAEAFITSGKMLDCPPNCPDELYKVMVMCWSNEPDYRPTMVLLLDKLRKIQR